MLQFYPVIITDYVSTYVSFVGEPVLANCKPEDVSASKSSSGYKKSVFWYDSLQEAKNRVDHEGGKLCNYRGSDYCRILRC